MIQITGYKQTTYPELQGILQRRLVDTDKTPVQIASEIKVKAALTVQNAFKGTGQIVSDDVLTNVMKSLGVTGLVVHTSEGKFYYIKNK